MPPGNKLNQMIVLLPRLTSFVIQERQILLVHLQTKSSTNESKSFPINSVSYFIWETPYTWLWIVTLGQKTETILLDFSMTKGFQNYFFFKLTVTALKNVKVSYWERIQGLRQGNHPQVLAKHHNSLAEFASLNSHKAFQCSEVSQLPIL